jgi:hypothetical protein
LARIALARLVLARFGALGVNRRRREEFRLARYLQRILVAMVW